MNGPDCSPPPAVVVRHRQMIAEYGSWWMRRNIILEELNQLLIVERDAARRIVGLRKGRRARRCRAASRRVDRGNATSRHR